MVPGVGFEPTSPRFRRGAFTRLASQANWRGRGESNSFRRSGAPALNQSTTSAWCAPEDSNLSSADLPVSQTPVLQTGGRRGTRIVHVGARHWPPKLRQKLAEGEGVEPSTLRSARFSGPVADHSAALSNCVPSGSRTPFSGLKVRHPSPRRPMGRCDPAGSRTRSCALRGRRHFRVVHRAWCWSISRPASRPRLCAASVWAAGIEPAWTWFRARWPAIDPHPVASCGVTGGDRTRTSSFTARRALQYTTATT